jgi:hypothetical protein
MKPAGVMPMMVDVRETREPVKDLAQC